MARISGNDIARYQGDINWDTYKNNSQFVIIKASEGTTGLDPKLARNQSEARRVGIPLGYYHFAHPELSTNTPEKEAQWFLDKIGKLQDGEVLCLDYEPPTRVQAHVDWCKNWLDYIYAKTGVKALIYMSESIVKQLDWQSVVNRGYGLWIAKYATNPSPDTAFNAGKWGNAAMYQWTSKQQVPGVSGNVDGDVFYGSQATFKKYGYVTPVTPPTPTPEPPTNGMTDDEKRALEQVREVQNSDGFGNLESASRAMKDGFRNAKVLQSQLDAANTKISKAKEVLA